MQLRGALLLLVSLGTPAARASDLILRLETAAVSEPLPERLRQALDPVLGTASCTYGYHHYAWEAAFRFGARFAAQWMKDGSYPTKEFVAALKDYIKRTPRLPTLKDKDDEMEMRGEFATHFVSLVQAFIERASRMKPPVKSPQEMVARIGELRAILLKSESQRAFFSELIAPMNSIRGLAHRHRLPCDADLLASLPKTPLYDSGPVQAGTYLTEIGSLEASLANEISAERPSGGKADGCFKAGNGTELKTFASVIDRAVQVHLDAEITGAEGKKIPTVMMGKIGGSFGLPDPGVAVSLSSHPMCSVTSGRLSASLRHAPSAQAVYFADSFAQKYNFLRAQMLAGTPGARRALEKLWSRFFGCLAFQESLTTADTKASFSIAEKFGVEVKPSGVKFYFDSWQSEPLSQFNIGLFQFSANLQGNLAPCVLNWNARTAGDACKIASKEPARTSGGLMAIQKDVIPLLGSPRQSFTTFCGVNKVSQTFFMQVNTMSTKRTSMANWLGDKFRAPAERCVSLHIKDAYAHFGPLINSTGENLGELMRCAAAE